MEITIPAAVFFGAALFTVLAVWGAVRILKRRAILDLPNERSSHDTPTLHGGGLAVIPIILLFWILLAFSPHGEADRALSLWIGGGALFLAVISWIDDLRGLSQITRLIVQYAVVAVILSIPGDIQPTFQGLFPEWADQVLTALLWVWFINLFNFMDGIDGISGIEAGAIGLGLAGIMFVTDQHLDLGLYGLAVAGAGIGFLWWNWQPAKIFLGDVGSIPLGFLLGWLLIELAGREMWVPAAILPLYYLGDATLTLGVRAARKEKIFQAHRDHFYQLAIKRGHSHARVALMIAAANVGLIVLALTSLAQPIPSLIAAAALTGWLLLNLAGRKAER